MKYPPYCSFIMIPVNLSLFYNIIVHIEIDLPLQPTRRAITVKIFILIIKFYKEVIRK